MEFTIRKRMTDYSSRRWIQLSCRALAACTTRCVFGFDIQVASSWCHFSVSALSHTIAESI